MKLLTQSLILILSIGGVFIWELTGLSDYNVETIALLVLTYLAVTFIRRKKKQDLVNVTGNIDIFLLNCVIFLLIFSTGALYSPLYFLIYFLAFGITFVFEPSMVFIFTIGVIILFIPEALKNYALESFIKIGSLLLIAPLAFFFGQSYKDREKEQAKLEAITERAKEAADTIATDVDTVLKKDEEHLDNDEIEKLNEILEETDDLRGESKEE